MYHGRVSRQRLVELFWPRRPLALRYPDRSRDEHGGGGRDRAPKSRGVRGDHRRRALVRRLVRGRQRKPARRAPSYGSRHRRSRPVRVDRSCRSRPASRCRRGDLGPGRGRSSDSPGERRRSVRIVFTVGRLSPDGESPDGRKSRRVLQVSDELVKLALARFVDDPPALDEPPSVTSESPPIVPAWTSCSIWIVGSDRPEPASSRTWRRASRSREPGRRARSRAWTRDIEGRSDRIRQARIGHRITGNGDWTLFIKMYGNDERVKSRHEGAAVHRDRHAAGDP